MILYLSIFLIMLELFYYECGTIVPVALYRLLYISKKKQSEIYLILIIKSDDAMVAIFKRASHRAVKFFFSFLPSSPSPVLSPQKRAQASIAI